MITPQSANWTALATQREGRGFRLLAHIEGLTDPVCNYAPADAWAKIYAVRNVTAGTGTRYIDCGTNTALTQLTDWTIAGWFYVSVVPGLGCAFAGSYSGAARGFGIGLWGGGTLLIWTTGGNVSTGIAISTGAWHYIAVSCGGTSAGVFRVVVDDTDYTFYNTAHAYSARNSWTAATSFMLLGDAGGHPNTEGRTGYDAVFNRALTHREMRAIKYRRIDKKLGNDDSEGLWDDCIAEWQAERGTGTTLVNNRNPGTHDGTFSTGIDWVSDACYTVTYRPVLAAGVSTGQSIDPLATRTSIQSTTLRLLDTDEWLTRVLQSTNLGLARKGVRVYLGFEGLLESEYQPIIVGQIGDVSYDAHVYDLEINDALFGVKQKVTLGKGTLGAGIAAGTTTAQVEVSRYFMNLADTEAVYASRVRIDDELIAIPEISGSSASVQLLGSTASAPVNLVRGDLGSTAASHSAGAAIQEVWSLLNISIPIGQQPMWLLLSLLLSSGGFGSASVYDEVTESCYTDATTRSRRGRGAGMSPSEVAIAEIEALGTALAMSPLEAYVEEDIQDLKDWVESQVLRPAGCYFSVKPDGRLTVRRLAVPTTSGVIYELRPDRFMRARMSATEGEIVNYVDVTYDYNPLTQTTAGFLVNTDATSGTKYGLRRRTYELPASVTLANLTTVTGWILQRFKNPYVTFTVECGLFESLLEISDAVYLMDSHLPNLTTGYRGVVKLLCEVIGRKFDAGTGKTQLTLVDVSRM